MRLEKIINEKPVSGEGGHYKLTLYYPVADYESREQQTRIKSFIKRAWRANNKLAAKLEGADKLWNRVRPKLERSYSLHQGVMIIAEVKGEELMRYRLYELEKKPEKQINWGEVYDLAQWSQIEEDKIQALILSLNQDGCGIYFLQDGKWREEEIEREPILRSSKDSLNKYAPSQKSGAYYSWGWDKQARRDESERQLFVKKIRDNLDKLDKKLPEPKQVILFYSQAMQEQQEGLREKLQLLYKEKLFVEKAINYQNQVELKRQVIRLIRQAQKRERKSELAKAKEEYGQLLMGWNKVAKAINKQQVRELFTTISKVEGYVVKPEIIFSYPVKNSKRVENLNAWLVKKVLQNGGKVIISKDKWVKDNGVVARTYY